MLNEAITPLRSFAGLTLGRASDRDLTVPLAEAINCAGYRDPGSPVASVTWGEHNEVQAVYDNTSESISIIMLNDGYEGSMRFESRPGGAFGRHSYEIGVSRAIQRDGLSVAFTRRNSAARSALLTELLDGMLFSFRPTAPPAPSNCEVTGGGCNVGSDDVTLSPVNVWFVFNAAGEVASLGTWWPWR